MLEEEGFTLAPGLHSASSWVSKAGAQKGNHVVWQAGGSKPSSCSSFYSIQVRSLLIGAVHTQGESSLLSESISHTQKYAEPISGLSPHHTIMTRHSREPHL